MSTDPGDDRETGGTAAESGGGTDSETAGDEDSGGAPASGDPTDVDEVGVEPTGADEVTSDERTWGILVHAVAFAGLVVPFANIVAPLVVWLVKKEESRFVDENGKQSLNFQITWTVFFVVATLTLLVGIGLILLPLVALAWLILVVLATVKASNGEVYDYPLTIDLVS